MLVLITYDVNTQTAAGRKRLRKVAKFYYLGEKYKNKVEHIGAKPGFDVTDTLIL